VALAFLTALALIARLGAAGLDSETVLNLGFIAPWPASPAPVLMILVDFGDYAATRACCFSLSTLQAAGIF